MYSLATLDPPVQQVVHVLPAAPAVVIIAFTPPRAPTAAPARRPARASLARRRRRHRIGPGR